MENYLKLSKKYILTYEVNGKKGSIKYSDLRKYYEYATKDDCEYIYADICEDKIIICFTVAQGQGGVVAVWDTVTNQFTHVSNGEYALAATIYKDNIYIISYIHNYNVKDFYQLSKIKYGCIDKNVDSLVMCELTDFTLVNSSINKMYIKNNHIYLNDKIIYSL